MAKVFLTTGATDYVVANTSDSVYGSTGTETISIASGKTAITVDTNTESVALTLASSSYKFKQTGNVLSVYATDGTTLVTAMAIGDTGSTLICNGVSYTVSISGGVMTLGEAVVSSSAVEALVPTVRGTAASLAANSAALVGDDNKVVITGYPSSAADLNTINTKTTGLVTIVGGPITGSATEVATFADTETAGTEISTVENYEVEVSGTDMTVTQANTIDAANGNGIITGTIVNTTTVANLKTLTNTGASNAYTVTIAAADATLAASDLTAVDNITSVAVNAAAVTTITGDMSEVSAVYSENSSGAITGLGNEAITLSDSGTIAAALLSQIGALTTGDVTASSISGVTGTVEQVIAAMVTAETKVTVADNATVTLSDSGSVAADVLSAIGGATTGTVTGSSISTVTGTSTEVTAALVTDETKVTVAANAAVTLSDTGSVAATVLSAIGGATTGTVTGSGISTVTGTSTDVTAALVTAATKVTVAADAAVTISGTDTTITQYNDIDDVTTGAVTVTLAATGGADVFKMNGVNILTIGESTAFTNGEDKLNFANAAKSGTLQAATAITNDNSGTDGATLNGTNTNIYVIDTDATDLNANNANHTISDFTDMAKVGAFLNEGFTTSTTDGKIDYFVINDGSDATKAYVYKYVDSDTAASAIATDGTGLTLIGTITTGSSAITISDIEIS